jgi:hypothetical protein
MGLKVVFGNVAILYTPYLHNPKHSFKKHLIKNIVLLKELNPNLEKKICPIVMEGRFAK